MTSNDPLEKSPREFTVGAGRARTIYVLDEAHCAIYGPHSEDAGFDIVFRFKEESIVVCRRVGPERAGVISGPVYRRGKGGELVVPTGRIFVRMRKGESIALHQSEIEAAGFELGKIPRYAPHAGWIRPKSGSVVEALKGLDRLQEIAGVEAVEPQILSLRSWR